MNLNLHKNIHRLLLAALVGTAASLATGVHAQTAAKAAPAAAAVSAGTGEAMAHTCAACHGTQGRLGDEYFMPLAGMPSRQFVDTMIAFREGKRPATLMNLVALGFNDAELKAMADYFAALPADLPNAGAKP